MSRHKIVVLSICCVLGQVASSVVTSVTAQDIKKIPDDLLFGTATSAYQIEGAWNEDGKGLSMWDHLARHNGSSVFDKTNGDIASDSYHLYKRDVEMLKELGVSAYRFSISWPRVLPYGIDNYTNPLGVAYYNNLINELLATGIEPYVTMYHWDLPQTFSEQGSWLNPEIADWFGNYARVLYREFGDRVKNWITLNEPHIHCSLGYEIAMHAPLIRSPGEAYYECGRNHILAHARAYHIYNDEGFRIAQNGRVGITLDLDWPEPASDSADDLQAAEDYKAFMFGQYADLIFTDRGQYPQVMIDNIAVKSANLGYSESRLRPFSTEEAAYVRRTADFMGINHYSSTMVYRNSTMPFFDAPSIDDDMNMGTYVNPSWPVNPEGWIAENANGFYKLLHYLKDNYGNPPIIITENGYSTGVTIMDDDRARYYKNYISALIDAKNEGANVRGYFAWSLMDNFQWCMGYSIRFGLYDVDIESEERTRTPKKSGLVYSQIVRTRAIDFSFDPDPTAVTGPLTDGASVTSVSLLCFLALIVHIL